jgi:hypothetical protein
VSHEWWATFTVLVSSAALRFPAGPKWTRTMATGNENEYAETMGKKLIERSDRGILFVKGIMQDSGEPANEKLEAPD